MTTIASSDERVRKVGLLGQLLKRPELGAVAGTVLVIVFFALTAGSSGLFSAKGVVNFMEVSAQLGVIASAAALLMISGEFDLSIGSMIGFVGVVMANLDQAGWHPVASGIMMLAFGLLFGALQGLVIDFCAIQPFIVTLAGLFMLRGGCFMVNLDSVPIRHPFVEAFADFKVPLPGGGFLASSAIVMLVALAVAMVIAHFTRFGTNVYAIGGDRQSAALMGVPMRRTTVGIYALGGFYSALGGVIYALYTASGYPLAGVGNELNAIAAVVLGGTLLTGGVGLVFGTLFGGLILGLIATLIIFDGSLNGAWIMIVSGLLLFAFILAQRVIMRSFLSRGI
jgi:galactofuranose transport system permease protein